MSILKSILIIYVVTQLIGLGVIIYMFKKRKHEKSIEDVKYKDYKKY